MQVNNVHDRRTVREVLLVGNYCHDTIIRRDGTIFETLGGAVAHAGAVLAALGVDFDVVAKVGPDFRYADEVVRLPTIVPQARTTALLDDYRGSERVATVQAAAPPIDAADLGGRPCRAALICGIAAEIRPATVARVRELSEIALGDAQAFVRRVGAGGRISLREPELALLAEMNRLDWLKLSLSEARVLEPSSLRCNAVVTDGERGCFLLQHGRETPVPAFPAVEVDPTGAGDCFLAGFAWGLLRGWGPPRAALFGNFCGALAVAHHGVRKLTLAELAAFSSATNG
jgi:1D-myo-inositol 3-kinase